MRVEVLKALELLPFMVHSLDNFRQLLEVLADHVDSGFADLQIVEDGCWFAGILVLKLAAAILWNHQSSLSVDDGKTEIKFVGAQHSILLVLIGLHVDLVQDGQ